MGSCEGLPDGAMICHHLHREIVMSKKGWKDLGPRARQLILLGTIFEGILKLVVLVDLKRRADSEINGTKARWAAAMLLNTAGVVPLLYLVRGRRPAHGAAGES